MDIEALDDYVLNRKLLEFVANAVSECEKLYEGKSKSFAVMLTELEAIQKILKDELVLTEVKPQAAEQLQEDKQERTQSQTASSIEDNLAENERLVYVRLYHKEMETLDEPRPNTSWVKPLFESVTQAEKLGLAVYENEEDIKKSLKGPRYGYVTVKIQLDQDITHKRPTKNDPLLNCQLLTIEKITVEQMLSFHHGEHEYPIVNGVMRRPKQ